MTLFPQPPKIIPIEGNENLKQLAEDHLTFVNVGLGYSLKVFIKAGYRTDGASVPQYLLDNEEIKNFIRWNYPKIQTRFDFENLVKHLVGTPWDMPRLLAALVHDVLYGRKWKLRWICDKVYQLILNSVHYDKARTGIEYVAIRLVGWRNWSAITEVEILQTKCLSEVGFIRTREIPAEIERLSSKAT